MLMIDRAGFPALAVNVTSGGGKFCIRRFRVNDGRTE
jgi:hypothetical protein